MNFADEVRADLQALVNERGFMASLISEVPLTTGPRPTFSTETVECKVVRQNNVRRYSVWQADDGDTLVTIAVGAPPLGLNALPVKGFYLRFFDILPGADPEDLSKTGYGERWNVVQSRDRRVDGEIVAFTLLVRR